VLRVLLVDDEELVRTGLQMILEAEEDITVVGHATTVRRG
jgi:YesN/AraC family two-component response regulator